MGLSILEYSGWFFLSILKFILTPSTMIAAEYSFLETFITVSISSCTGATIFYFFGDFVFSWIDSRRKNKRKVFTPSTRKIIQIKQRYGLLGIGVIAGFISVPLAGILTSRFFRDPRVALPALMIAFTSWTAILTGVSWLIRQSML